MDKAAAYLPQSEGYLPLYILIVSVNTGNPTTTCWQRRGWSNSSHQRHFLLQHRRLRTTPLCRSCTWFNFRVQENHHHRNQLHRGPRTRKGASQTVGRLHRHRWARVSRYTPLFKNIRYLEHCCRYCEVVCCISYPWAILVSHADDHQHHWTGPFRSRSSCVQDGASFGSVLCSDRGGCHRSDLEYRPVQLLCPIALVPASKGNVQLCGQFFMILLSAACFCTAPHRSLVVWQWLARAWCLSAARPTSRTLPRTSWLLNFGGEVDRSGGVDSSTRSPLCLRPAVLDVCPCCTGSWSRKGCRSVWSLLQSPPPTASVLALTDRSTTEYAWWARSWPRMAK